MSRDGGAVSILKVARVVELRDVDDRGGAGSCAGGGVRGGEGCRHQHVDDGSLLTIGRGSDACEMQCGTPLGIAGMDIGMRAQEQSDALRVAVP